MATLTTLSPQAIHPLHAALGKTWGLDDLEKCRVLYNCLPDGSDQPPVLEEHIKNLGALFLQHKVDKVLGIHLIHGHFQLPQDRVLVGTNFENPTGRWTRATNLHTLQGANIHGHIFVFVDDGEGVLAHEFQEGPLSDMSGVSPDFLPEFISYITTHNLSGLIGLQVLCCEHESADIQPP